MTGAMQILAHSVFPDRTEVFTVFVILSHNHLQLGPPTLWETLVMPASRLATKLSQRPRRYKTLESALAGHKEVCDSLTIALAIN